VQPRRVTPRASNRTTGKFAQRLGVAASLRAFLSASYPELVPGIFTNARGADASDPAAASLDALVNLFVEGRQYVLTGAPANLALYRRRLVGVSCRPAQRTGVHDTQPTGRAASRFGAGGLRT
jgi:hypothetical protein